MIQVCYYCNHVYGEKDPLEKIEITSGECPLCHLLFKIWYQARRHGKISQVQPASAFISECRKTLTEGKELKIEQYL